jgi:O-antigen/teichoic acid export membrane protein
VAEARSDVEVFARRGLLTLVGGIVSGLLGFLALVVVSRGAGAAETGRFFEGLSLFNIASGVLVLGADVALIRFVSTDRAEQAGETRHLLRIALVPVFVVSVLASLAGVAFAPWLARGLADREADDLAMYLLWLIVALPIAVVYQAAISATRAFGTVRPFVLIDKIGRPGLQVLSLFLVVSLGLGSVALAGAWVLPIALALVATVWWLRVPTRDDLTRAPPARPRASASASASASAFWRFALPRGLAGTFQVLILWLDTLLIGLLRPSAEVAVYVASTRYVLLVLFVGNAVTQAVVPQFGDLLARRELRRAEAVYETATVSNIAVTWPLLVTLIVFAPVLLGVFGTRFEVGADATRILAVAMMVGTAVGPVDWVLLMGGKSSWNLLNTAAAVAVNVALNVALIPRLGIAGAAIAWGSSVVVNNVAPLIEVMALIRIDPFNAAHPIICAASVVCFAVPGVVALAVAGPTWPALIVSTVVGAAAYVTVLSRFAEAVSLAELWAALRPGRRSPRSVRPRR